MRPLILRRHTVPRENPKFPGSRVRTHMWEAKAPMKIWDTGGWTVEPHKNNFFYIIFMKKGKIFSHKKYILDTPHIFVGKMFNFPSSYIFFNDFDNQFFSNLFTFESKHFQDILSNWNFSNTFEEAREAYISLLGKITRHFWVSALYKNGGPVLRKDILIPPTPQKWPYLHKGCTQCWI